MVPHATLCHQPCLLPTGNKIEAKIAGTGLALTLPRSIAVCGFLLRSALLGAPKTLSSANRETSPIPEDEPREWPCLHRQDRVDGVSCSVPGGGKD